MWLRERLSNINLGPRVDATWTTSEFQKLLGKFLAKHKLIVSQVQPSESADNKQARGKPDNLTLS